MSDRSTTTIPDQVGTAAWEGEGGALKPSLPDELPEGIVAIPTIQYRVGPYSYHSLEDALAERRRQTGK